MRRNGARKLDRKSQETLRVRGVKAVLSGESPTKMAKLLGINQDTIQGQLNTSLSKTFCPLPWIHISGNNAGHGRVCCDGYERLKGESESWENAKDLNSYFNSDDYKKIRMQMLRGERPVHCLPCFNQEDHGVESARKQFLQQYQSEIQSLIKETNPDGSINNPRILYLDIALGNDCNIRCRMCSPFVSYPIARDWKKMQKNLPYDEIEKVFRNKWYASPQSFNLIKQALPTTKVIFLTGGEPMLVKEHIRILEMIIDEGHAGHISLRYNSNQTVIPQEVVKIWKYFEMIDFNCSVEAYGALNDYIRYPTRWEKQEKNLYFLDNISAQENNLNIFIHSTFQAYNILGIPDFLDFLRNAKFKRVYRFPYFIWVKKPEWLMSSIFPLSFKRRVADRILKKIDQHEKFFLTYEPSHRDLSYQRMQTLREMVEMMKNEKTPSKHLELFVKETNSYDKLRKQSVLKVLPEMAPFFEKSQRDSIYE